MKLRHIPMRDEDISGEGELICCFHKQLPALFGQFYHVAGGKKRGKEAGKS